MRVVEVESVEQPPARPVRHFTEEELDRKRGEGLADAIRATPGVAVLRGSAGGMGKPMIRGQLGRRNLISFDGVRHEGQKWGIDHAPEIDPQAAGGITVVKGAATTRFGADAIGGAIIIHPRPLRSTPGIDGQFGFFGYSNPFGGGISGRLDHAPQRLEGFAWRGDANMSWHRANVAPDYALDNTARRVWNAGARVGWKGQRIALVASHRWTTNRAGICTCLRISSPEDFSRALERNWPLNADAFVADFEIERGYQDVRHVVSTVRADVDLGRAGVMRSVYAMQHNDRREFAIARKSVTGPQLSLTLATHSFDAEFDHEPRHFGRHWQLTGTAGIHLSHQNNDIISQATLIPDYSQMRASAYLVERLSQDKLELELGVRYSGLRRNARLVERDYLAQSAAGRLSDDTCVRTADDGASCKLGFHAPSTALGMALQPLARARWLTLRLQLDSSARIPAIDEHFMNGAAASFPILGFGDPSLGIERTWGSTATIDISHTHIGLQASAYLNRIDDYIYFRAKPQAGQCAPLTCTARGAFPLFVFEAIDARFVGGEVGLHLQAPDLPLQLLASGSWVRGFDRDESGQLSFLPADHYKLTGKVDWPATRHTRNGYIEISPEIVARHSAYDTDGDFAPSPPSYVSLGAAVGLEIVGRSTVTRLGLHGNNLLNRRYRDRSSLLRYFADEPGWTVQLRMSLEFDRPMARRADLVAFH